MRNSGAHQSLHTDPNPWSPQGALIKPSETRNKIIGVNVRETYRSKQSREDGQGGSESVKAVSKSVQCTLCV